MPKLNRNGVNIYYEVHGSGPVILLTHGYSATAQMWKGQIEPLTKKHTLVTWDMRGHGQSDYPADQSAYSEEATVGDMAAILDAVGAKKAIVGGLSLGGYMSLAFYRVHPERVNALLIIDTGPGFKKDDAREVWNKRARETGDRYDKEGLAVLKSGSAERAYAVHRSADGLARAARGMLAQKNSAVIEVAAQHQGAVDRDRRLERHAVPRRLRLHGCEDPGLQESRDPQRRPRRQYRPAEGVQRGGGGLHRRVGGISRMLTSSS